MKKAIFMPIIDGIYRLNSKNRKLKINDVIELIRNGSLKGYLILDKLQENYVEIPSTYWSEVASQALKRSSSEEKLPYKMSAGLLQTHISLFLFKIEEAIRLNAAINPDDYLGFENSFLTFENLHLNTEKIQSGYFAMMRHFRQKITIKLPVCLKISDISKFATEKDAKIIQSNSQKKVATDELWHILVTLLLEEMANPNPIKQMTFKALFEEKATQFEINNKIILIKSVGGNEEKISPSFLNKMVLDLWKFQNFKTLIKKTDSEKEEPKIEVSEPQT